MNTFYKYNLLAFFIVIGIPGHSQNSTLDSLKQLLQKASIETEKLRLLNVITPKEYDEHVAIATANKAIALATKLNDKRALSAALNNISTSYINMDMYSDAVSYAQKAYQLSSQNDDNENQSSALLNLGRSYYELGKYHEALNFLNEQMKLFPKIKYNIEILMCYNTVAAIYYDLGNMKNAHEYYMKELEIAEKKNNKTYMAQSYNNLANVYDSQKKYDKALEYYMKDLKITELLNDESSLSTSYNNIGDIYLTLKDYKKAKENIEKAVEIAERLNYKEGLAIYYNSLATYYQDVGENDKALTYFKKDLENSVAMGNKYNLGVSYQTLGDFYLSIKKGEEAEKNYLSALKIGNEIKALNITSPVYNGLARLYEQKNDFKNAYKYHVLYKMQYDSVFNLESEKTISELSTRYESEKKEQTITLLNKEKELKNNEIKKQKLIRYSFTIGFILMLVLVFMVFKSYRIKHKANELLAFQKQEIEVKNDELQLSKNELQKQKDLVDVKQKEIVDSINYAKRIQYTLLAHEESLKENLKEHFVVFKPKDIVSGDFYWATSVGSSELGVRKSNPTSSYELSTPNSELFILAVCDSTGHGVPGAFMSLLNIGFLSEAINEKGITEPDKIFNYVRKRLIENVSKEDQKDGFDGVLLCINKPLKTITYASANLTALMIHNDHITELETDKMPVGVGEKQNDFRLFTLNYTEGATIYVCTDGYADQFGGQKGKKFKNKQLTELLLKSSSSDLATQQQILTDRFNEWKGDLEQVDDVCVVGVRL